MRPSPLARFSAYGFLKNQRYFEPFLVVALLAKGLDFFDIGVLVAFKELTVNAVEIPSGAIADAYGRRRAMIVSFLAYIVSFAVFGGADSMAWFFGAMAAYGVGDAFRTGTHKAMIFAWLHSEGRADERTKVYGYTRSWSKLGSAVCALAAAAFVLVGNDYDWIFYAAIGPYILNILNFMGYPDAVDGGREQAEPRGFLGVMRDAAVTVKSAFSAPRLRRLMLESMGFEGIFHAVKDYLQPVLVAASVTWLVTAEVSEVQRSALLIGPVYFALHLMSSFASRRADSFARWSGGETPGAARLWALVLVVFVGFTAAALLAQPAALIMAFVGLYVLQNLWRPLLVSRIDAISDRSQGATLLSVESQSRRVTTMMLAPPLGWAVDTLGRVDADVALWPIGVLGLAVALVFVIWREPASTKVAAA